MDRLAPGRAAGTVAVERGSVAGRSKAPLQAPSSVRASGRLALPLLWALVWACVAAAQPTSRCEGIDYLEPPAGSAEIAIDELEGQTAFVPPRRAHATGWVSGTCVLLFRRGAETPVVIGTSDERGRFAFSRPEPGPYILVAVSESFHDLAVSLRVSDSRPYPGAARGLLLRMYMEEDGRGSSASVIRRLALRRELLGMAQVDQAVRNELIEAGAATPDPELLSRMAAIDARNTARLQAIVEEHGWPGPDLVGTDGAGSASLLLQHASHDVQRALLPLVEAGYREGRVPGNRYAELLDRVLVGEGRLQVYGTQAEPFAAWIDGEPALAPIEDGANVDARRAEVGLMPLVEYRELLKRLYFPER